MFAQAAVKAQQHAVAIFDMSSANATEFRLCFAIILLQTLEDVNNLKFEEVFVGLVADLLRLAVSFYF